MAAAVFNDLPIEHREVIWSLALLPKPGVYKYEPRSFIPLPRNMDGWEHSPWMIPKRRYPTVMHLCQESRRFSLYIKAQEQKQVEDNGTTPYYCLGENSRPFIPATDTLWFSKKSLLHHHWVTNLTSVIGSRLDIIENLAVSRECFTFPLPEPRVPTRWNSFRWHRLLRIMELRRFDVIFAERSVDEDNNVEDTYGSLPNYLEKVEELRLEKWTEGSSAERVDEVETLMKCVRTSVVEPFQDTYEQMMVNNVEELICFPDDAPNWHDGSRITFHASQVFKVKTTLIPAYPQVV